MLYRLITAIKQAAKDEPPYCEGCSRYIANVEPVTLTGKFRPITKRLCPYCRQQQRWKERIRSNTPA